MKKIQHARHVIYRAKKNQNTHRSSRQEEYNHSPYHNPPVSFENLMLVYAGSFVVFGLAELVATTAAQGWEYGEEVSDETKALLSTIDQKELFLSMFVTGNFFLERLKNGFGQTKKLQSFLTRQVKLKRGGGLTQFDGGKKTDFAEDEYIHLKTSSILSKKYGQTKIASAVEQIVLLNYIDRYYGNLFDGGMLGTKVFFTENGVQMSEDEAMQISDAFNEKTKGVDNAFDTLVVPFKIQKLDIDDIGNTDKFLKYREDLIQSIAIALGVPVEILLPQRASRATMAESIARLNTDIVYPLQVQVMQQLQGALADEYSDIVGVNFAAVDTKNQVQEVEMASVLFREGIATANEARSRVGLTEREDGNMLRVSTLSSDEEAIQKEMLSIQKNIAKLYDAQK